MLRQLLLSQPTPSRIRDALRLGYRFSRQGNQGLALIGSDLWVTSAPGVLGDGSGAAAEGELAAVVEAWRTATLASRVGSISAGTDAAQARLRSMVLNSSPLPGSRRA